MPSAPGARSMTPVHRSTPPACCRTARRLPASRTFRESLLSSDLFVQTLTEKLLTYALGRGVEPYDMPAVRGIVRDAADDDYRFSSFILGVVESTPFTMRRAGS